MLTKYEYRMLRYIKRRKTCSPERIRKKFGPGAEERLRRMREYVDRPLAELENGGYSCMYDGNYFLTDAGDFALAEFSSSSRSKRMDRIGGFMAGILSSVLYYLLTEYLLPLIFR